MTFFFVLLGILIVLILFLLFWNIRIVPQAEAKVIERLGSFKTVWEAGLHIKIPFVDRISNSVILKEQVADFPPQAVITKDNVTMQIDTVVYFKVVDPELYTYGVNRPIEAIENLSATTLRNVIGNLELDETLTSRDKINTELRDALDEATDPWGIKVSRVELKNILPPKEIQASMEKQMKAEREKRAQILTAEGNKQAQITEAQGYKEAQVLKAEGEKEVKILKAEANKRSIELEAEAQAASIRLVKQAEADGIVLINEAKPTKEVLTIKGYDALVEVANGQSNTVVVPNDLSALTSVLVSGKEVLSTTEKLKEK